jgi:hypothetical protein
MSTLAGKTIAYDPVKQEYSIVSEPEAPPTMPGSDSLAAMRTALEGIDNHIETIRHLLTNAMSLTADLRRRIDALEAAQRGRP